MNDVEETDMTAISNGSDDAGIVRDLEAVYRRIEEAAAVDLSPERSGVLNSLRLMLQPSIRAARLLAEETPSREPA